MSFEGFLQFGAPALQNRFAGIIAQVSLHHVVVLPILRRRGLAYPY
jgi:hypothetical protein